MKVFVSAQSPNPDGPVESRYGRCAWFISYDSDTKKWDAVKNPGAEKAGGAGVSAAEFVVYHQASVVISGDFGPQAASALNAARVEMRQFDNRGATARQVVESYLQSKGMA